MALVQLPGEPAHEAAWLVGGQLCDLNEAGDLIFPDGSQVPQGHGFTLPRDIGLELVGGYWLKKFDIGI